MRQIKIFITFLGFVFLIGFSTYTVKADVLQVTVNAPEPSCGDNQGYLNLLFRNADNTAFQTQTYFWTTYGSYKSSEYNTASYQPLMCNIRVSDTALDFGVSGLNYSVADAVIALYRITPTGSYQYIGTYTSTPPSVTLPTGFTLLGYKYKGNVGSISGSYTYTYNIVWGSDNGVVDASRQILDLLSENNELAEKSNSYIQNIIDIINTRFDNLESSMQQLSANVSFILGEMHGWFPIMNDNLNDINTRLSIANTHLDIIERRTQNIQTLLEDMKKDIEEQQQKEADQATQQGNATVDDSSSAIQDNSGSLKDAFSSFLGVITYTGLDCNIPVPEIYIPAISGVIGRTVLFGGGELDLQYWISQIPILEFVQVLLTISLCLFGVKEFYNLIYSLLGTKGDANE